jgi:hypothetical protein
MIRAISVVSRATELQRCFVRQEQRPQHDIDQERSFCSRSAYVGLHFLFTLQLQLTRLHRNAMGWTKALRSTNPAGRAGGWDGDRVGEETHDYCVSRKGVLVSYSARRAFKLSMRDCVLSCCAARAKAFCTVSKATANFPASA